MKTRLVSDFESRTAKRCAPLAGSAFFAADRRTSHPSATLLLRIQQSSPHHEQIRQRGADFEPVQVLRESAVTHLLEAEDPLDHPNACSTFARTRDLVRFLALMTSSTRPPRL